MKLQVYAEKLQLTFYLGRKPYERAFKGSFDANYRNGLKKRNLMAENIQLGVMDGLTGLEKVFQEEFPNASIQRCQVHVLRNVLAKVSSKLKKEVADSIRDIFYASSSKRAKDN